MLDKLIKTLKNPNSIDDIVGQKYLLDEIGIIRRMVNHHQVFNLIFYGPPGVGKSSLAKVLAQDLKVPFAFFNPVVDSKKQLMQIIEQALDLNNFIIIIDEIHRLNKDKQDILLPIIEANKIKLFATTTENPFFVINPALRSRCQLLSLKPLTSSQISERIKTLINVEEVFEPQAFNLLINKTNGDLRAVINTLEIIYLLYKEHKVDYVLLKRIMQESYALGSSDGDEIHDLKSAFHKSMRGSDCDAALYYLARLIIIGDFEAIYRRVSVCVHEDIGLANPNLCLRVDQGINSCRFLGYPENQVILANLVLQICLSNKSNSVYLAYQKAFEDAANGKQYSIPNHVRDAHYASAIKLGVHGYKYPHDFKNNYVNQQYLPRELTNKKYYVPQNNEQEFKLNQNQQKFKNNN
ncbi:replication-associated recombination protein A [Ureaplasma parvum]|uniref:AAA family ATPase n=1 Tax=Ureaplasma parvum TaxID=134821 RepID=A0AAC9T334_UREPR|nr:replication-associated recombination protein A [Ureaplasma parvum]ASD24482.1 AAA family ATPase [Ureaplasma parvum]ASD25236.1 AAA family ATPase [Ureaplasma parvum]ASD28841.1 AAA family ATPase [Ureaplasma parvum]ASD29484.1 AAA family ATPase [Ureaplasma parvum]ASD29878.1 AAA family ATPase [Ureaplasma parvum]